MLSPRPPWPTRFMPSFQSPVPISGRPCAPAVMPLLDGAEAVLEQRAVFGRRRSAGRRLRARRSRAAAPRRNGTRSSSTRGVAGGAHVLGDHERQPQQIVGAAAAQAAAGRLVPPVLHVAFDELPAGGAQQVLARQVRPRQQQRHHVLQLIAEAEGAARLVVAGARPEPAADGLIEQPAVHQHVERIVRRAHLDRVERAVPRRLRRVRSAAAAASTRP